MEVDEEEFGGTRVALEKGDTLRSVPRSHRHLLTAEVKAWWADPRAAIRGVADEAVTRNMGRWFRRMADGGSWRLELHKASHGATRAGYRLSCPGVRGAEVAPPPAKAPGNRLPAGLSDYYRLVSHVDWMGFGAAGGLEGAEGHLSLSAFRYEYRGARIDPSRAFVFGWSPGGDMLIYTADGRGGWLCHENGKVHLLGTVLDTIDWVFGQLLADRCPNLDYSRP